MERKPSYYSIIPATVRYDQNLSASEKLIYSEISALVNMYGHCFASNQYFSDLYGVSKVTVSRWISALAEQGHVTCKNIMNGRQIEKRQIFLVAEPINKNDNRGIDENAKGGINRNVKDNNTSNNTNKKGRVTKSLTQMMLSDSRYKSLSSVSGISTSLDMFEGHRQEIRKPMTTHAKKLMLGKLVEYKEQGHNVVEMIEFAVERGWLSVYPPKQKKGHSDAQIIRGGVL